MNVERFVKDFHDEINYIQKDGMDNELYDKVLVIRLEQALAREREAALEEAAAIADARHAEHQALLDKGKGTWPNKEYVRDETWATWAGHSMEAERIAKRIRALKAVGVNQAAG